MSSKKENRDTRKAAGRIGEQAADQYLLLQGYDIIERNWRCRSGEIDLIASRAEELVFVEVRSRRRGGRFGTAAESVDHRKQQKVRSTSEVYLRYHHKQESKVRYDLITVELDDNNRAVRLDHYRYAF